MPHLFSHAEDEKGKVFDFEVIEGNQLKCKMEPEQLQKELGFLSHYSYGRSCIPDIEWLDRYSIGSKVQIKKIESDCSSTKV